MSGQEILFNLVATAFEKKGEVFDAVICREVEMSAKEQGLVLVKAETLATALVGWLEHIDENIAQAVAADKVGNAQLLLEMIQEIPTT